MNDSSTTRQRRIQRGTILFPGMYHSEEVVPPAMIEDVREIARKGYHAIEIFPLVGQGEFVRAFCREVAAFDLELWVLTNYMKYQEAYLAEHPEQRMVMAKDALDSDGLSASTWGCPFNPTFKERGLDFLREIAAQPGVTRIGLNDEAMLLSGCYCSVCRAAYQDEFGEEMPLKVEPRAEDWQEESWRCYLRWRMERWNQVHAEQLEAIRAINPVIRVLFQSSPACDLWLNPWETGVDLSEMVEFLDGLSTDPYYTFHDRHFHPAEVYLSEWSKFLRGIVPAEKEAEIVVQGFSHPTFSRPLGREDGYWSSLVPLACGIDLITPYTYTFQRCSPVQETYEACFKFDQYFEKALPLQYAGVVHGAQTETYYRPLPTAVPHSYDWTRLLPVTEALRHAGLPYSYIADRRLSEANSFAGWKVLILPEIACLSESQTQSLRRYISEGGNLVLLGDLGSADEIGTPKAHSLLRELFGIEITAETSGDRRFRLTRHHPATGNLDPAIPECRVAGAQQPIFALRQSLKANLPEGAEVLAEFLDERGEPTGEPAIAVLPGGGRVLWFAGFPTRTVTHPVFQTVVQNRAHALFAEATAWAAGEKPRLRVENWPPEVPIKKLRPFDARYMSTFEFFPLEGEELFLGVVTSYFKEPATFPLVLDLPAGKQLRRVRELIGGREVPCEVAEGRATVAVELDFDTAALVYLFELES